MAVYTEVSNEELSSLLARYGLGSLRACKGIAEGVENSNFLIQATAGTFILTLYEKRVAPADLPFFLGLMEHLSRRGLTCPLPVHDRDGQVLTMVGGRPAALVTFLEGLWVKLPTPTHCVAVGDALARLHIAGADFALQRANALGPDGWNPLFGRFAARADEIAPGLEKFIADELATLLPAWPRALPQGVIHADLFPDNVFFLGDQLSGLIDFYFACNDILAYDIAVCLNAWCFEPDFTFNVENAQALLKGYQGVRRLQPAEVAALPLLARGAALRFLLTRAYDWLHRPIGALVAPHNPLDYVRRLEFHQSVQSPEGYGLHE